MPSPLHHRVRAAAASPSPGTYLWNYHIDSTGIIRISGGQSTNKSANKAKSVMRGTRPPRIAQTAFLAARYACYVCRGATEAIRDERDIAGNSRRTHHSVAQALPDVDAPGGRPLVRRMVGSRMLGHQARRGNWRVAGVTFGRADAAIKTVFNPAADTGSCTLPC